MVEYKEELVDDVLGSMSKFKDAGFVKLKSAHRELYLKDGVPHKDDGPAGYIYDEADGTLVREVYFVNGLAHRVNGPAAVYYDHGKVVDEKYAVEGKEMSEAEFLARK